MKRPCVFFDRDGIANIEPSPEQYYILAPEQLLVYPPFIEALKIVAAKGYAAVVVTNQKCVHKELLTLEGLDAIHQVLREAVVAGNAELLDIYSCPHGDGHPDQKPRPGMLLRAAEDHDLDLSRSWMIGDQERDIQAGQSAGCVATVLVNQDIRETAGDWRIDSMDALPSLLEAQLPVA